jgi:hypothetical protein
MRRPECGPHTVTRKSSKMLRGYILAKFYHHVTIHFEKDAGYGEFFGRLG